MQVSGFSYPCSEVWARQCEVKNRTGTPQTIARALVLATSMGLFVLLAPGSICLGKEAAGQEPPTLPSLVPQLATGPSPQKGHGDSFSPTVFFSRGGGQHGKELHLNPGEEVQTGLTHVAIHEENDMGKCPLWA